MGKVKVQFLDWGKVSYQEAWERQTLLHNELKERKVNNRRNGTNIEQKHYLVFCEHLPVYTLGKSGKKENLLLNQEELKEEKIEFFKINRGGDITFHGLGQIVAYPIFDLDEIFTDVHKYVRYLEQAVMHVLSKHNIESIRLKDFTGVWLPPEGSEKQRKICAIGVHLSRWVTMHGLAFNVNTDLSYFNKIIPCGINDDDKEVTSMARELGVELEYDKIKEDLKSAFEETFNIELYV